MTPTKVKDLIPEVAKKLGIPEEHLAAMYSFYIKENKKILSNMEELHVTLKGLGTMTIKGWEIKKEIERRNAKILNSFNEENIKELREEIVLYEKVLVKWEEQEQRKKLTGKKKQEFYKNKEKEANNESERKTTGSLE
jgi:hypothetical protein